MNIGLAVDKKNGVESKVIGIKEHCKKDFKEGNLYAQDEANKNNTKCFGYGIEIIREAQNQWRGWGTSLKPSFEPIIVARKSLDGSCVDNVIKWGVGGINIDECRVPAEEGEYDIRHYTNEDCFQNLKPKQSKFVVEPQPDGRFPANTILTYDDTDYEEVCGGFPNSKGSSSQNVFTTSSKYGGNALLNSSTPRFPYQDGYNDNGSASRYFYCAKASKKDRDDGLDGFDEQQVKGLEGGKLQSETSDDKYTTVKRNIHPTVKPTELMQYLVRLVTPKGGVVLDPFNGSGSTGKAVMFENRERNARYKYIGIELDSSYCEISKARIFYALNDYVYSKDTEDKNDNSVLKNNKSKCITLW